MRLIALSILAVLAAVPALTAPALAKPPQRQQSPDLVDVVFSEIEKRLIREYYAGQGHGAAPDNLPPGIRKRVERRVIGSDVVLVAVATNIVLDIIFDAIKHG
jgi:hypothetical protein